MADNKQSALVWETDIPVATHPIMIGNFVKVFGITGLIMGGLMTFLLGMNGDWKAVPPILEMMCMIVGGLFVLSLLVALLFYGNRMHMRFSVDARAASAAVADSRAKKANRAAMVLGLVAMKPGVVGAGLLAEANASQSIVWDAVAKAHFHPSWRTISLSNGWRTVLVLFCTPQNYAAVAAQVQAGLAGRKVAVHRSPLPKLLMHTFFIVVSCMPLFALPFVEEQGMLPALLVLCFALASLWLLPVLSWAVYAGMAWLALLEVAACAETRDSIFGGTYTAYEVLDDGDKITLGLAAAGAAYLVWLTIGLMRGTIRAGLAGDMEENEGGVSGGALKA